MALTPLVVALVRSSTAPRSLRRAFFLGLLTGGVYFAVTLYWLVATMTTFGGLPNAVAFVAAVLLVAYLSLFPAVFAMVVTRLRRSMGVHGAVLSAAPVWVASELGRQYVWDGFPWALLGYSQVSVLPIAQIASVTGVYGLSFLLVLTASAVALVIVERDARRWTSAAAVAILIVVCAVWGRYRMGEGSLASAGNPVRVAVVQGNILQSDKWNPALRDAIIGRYIAMTRQAIERGATFIIWPESSMPVNFEDDAIRSTPIRRLASESNVTLLIGSDQEEGLRSGLRAGDPGYHIYNAAFLIKPDGSVGAVYRKMHLVPFGEYVPLQRLLFFVAPIVERMSPFTPGETATVLPVGPHMASTGDLLRSDFWQLDPRVRPERQRAPHDDHQRRVVWPDVCSLPTLGSGLDAGDRERAVPRACREHRHQRLRRSVWTSGREVTGLRASPARPRHPVPADAHDLHANRRSHRVAVPGLFAGGAIGGVASGVHYVAAANTIHSNPWLSNQLRNSSVGMKT